MKYSEEHHMNNANLLKTALLVGLFLEANMVTIQIQQIFKMLYISTARKYGKNDETYTD